MTRLLRLGLLLSFTLSLFGSARFVHAAPVAPKAPYFTIEVVDETTGRGVPLVELKTTNDVRYYTDSNGIVAYHEPGLMGEKGLYSRSM